ncbi:unnamed protein product [Fusarium graminearum]|nr:unnamed protein product [Fusarium graminearum]
MGPRSNFLLSTGEIRLGRALFALVEHPTPRHGEWRASRAINCGRPGTLGRASFNCTIPTPILFFNPFFVFYDLLGSRKVDLLSLRI